MPPPDRPGLADSVEPSDRQQLEPVFSEPHRSTLRPMRPFGIQEGAALVAVERANGGELAPLLQVLWTLHGFTPPGSRPSPAEFAASTTLLIELGVVEYLDYQLGLTPEGRKLLRRSGMPNDARHVAFVTEVLQEFGEDDFEPDESAATPTEEDVRQALSEGDGVQETRGRHRYTRHRGEHPDLLANPRSRHARPHHEVGALGAGRPAQRLRPRPGTARARSADGVAGASSPRPLVRSRATRSQRTRWRGRRLRRRRHGLRLAGRLLGRRLTNRRPGR